MKKCDSITVKDSVKTKKRLWNLLLAVIAISLVLVLTASVRMVNFAMESQPDCMEHERTDDNNSERFLAAKSSC